MVFSWQMAEQLAAAHMRSLGFGDARVTRDGTDGGIDVASSAAVAQVKAHIAPVGAPDVQRLKGAAHGQAHALFYSLAGYTAAAVTYADSAGVALFGFTETNQVTANNVVARALEGQASAITFFRALVGQATNTRNRVAAWSKVLTSRDEKAIETLLEVLGEWSAKVPETREELDELTDHGKAIPTWLTDLTRERQRLDKILATDKPRIETLTSFFGTADKLATRMTRAIEFHDEEGSPEEREKLQASVDALERKVAKFSGEIEGADPELFALFLEQLEHIPDDTNATDG